MGIYIRGMKMPTNCDDCLLGSDCPHDQSIDGYKMQGGRPRTCPLVHIPPHGRLGDLDALYESCALDTNIDVMASAKRINEYMQLKIDEAPTIIPAEQKGE